MTNKLKFFVGNWKMNGDLNSIKTLKKINFFLRQKKSLLKIKTVVCLPFTLLYPFSKYLRNTEIIMGAQNCHEFGTYGSFTGSISAQMIKNTVAKYVIIGHSENRLNGDDNIKIKKKIESAVDQNLNIIYCVGESYKQKKEKKTFKIIKNQISSIIKKKIDPNKFILAYEPIWSIGTGKLPKAEDLKRMAELIKNVEKLIKEYHS